MRSLLRNVQCKIPRILRLGQTTHNKQYVEGLLISLLGLFSKECKGFVDFFNISSILWKFYPRHFLA